ncbi:MAG: hypothetical protein IJ226_03935 [Clostridia bacterium]|nr:hypothetical protein [Clostridia bacterium]
MNFWERDENTYKNYNSNSQSAYNASNKRENHAYFQNEDTNSNATVDTQSFADSSEFWQQKVGEYAGKSQQELMQELMSTSARMKQNGELTSADLDNFYSKVQGFLNEEQRQRMKSLIETLKR